MTKTGSMQVMMLAAELVGGAVKPRKSELPLRSS